MLTGKKRCLCVCVRREQGEDHWRGAGGPERGDNTRMMGRLHRDSVEEVTTQHAAE